MGKQKLNSCASRKDLEGEIMDLEKLSASTENQGYIESLKSTKMALKNLLGTKV